jgi:hypothetical protein
LPPLQEAADAFARPIFAAPIACKHVLAIGLKESGLVETLQRGIGGKPMPELARGWHQLEKRGGVAEIIAHKALGWVRTQIVKMGYPLDADALHYALAYDQRLSSLCARGLLWLDPAALVDDREVAFELYLRRWRPGAWTRGTEEGRAELRKRWKTSWRLAGEAIERAEWPEVAVGTPEPVVEPEPAPEDPGTLYVLRSSYAGSPVWYIGGIDGPSSMEMVATTHLLREATKMTEAEAREAIRIWRPLADYVMEPVDA